MTDEIKRMIDADGYAALKRAGRIDDYDPQLCAICAKFLEE